MKIANAYVSQIQTNRMGDRSEMFRVVASYEIPGIEGLCGIVGSMEFNAPMSEAKKFYVGQKLTLSVEITE